MRRDPECVALGLVALDHLVALVLLAATKRGALGLLAAGEGRDRLDLLVGELHENVERGTNAPPSTEIITFCKKSSQTIFASVPVLKGSAALFRKGRTTPPR